MRKITLIFSLLVAMVISATAQTVIDLTAVEYGTGVTSNKNTASTWTFNEGLVINATDADGNAVASMRNYNGFKLYINENVKLPITYTLTVPEGYSLTEMKFKNVTSSSDFTLLYKGYPYVMKDNKAEETITFAEGRNSFELNGTGVVGRDIQITSLTMTRTSAPALEAPVLKSPDTKKDITHVYGISLQFQEAVAINPEFDGDVNLMMNGEKVDFAFSWNVPGWDPTLVNFELANGANTPGAYSFVVPEGLISSADGSKAYEGGTFSFEIVPPAPSYSLTPGNNSSATSIDKISIAFYDTESIEFDESLLGDIMLYNDDYTFYAANFENSVDKEGNSVITITLEGTADVPGNYTLSLPDGLFTMNGVNGDVVEYVANPDESIVYTITEPVTVTPLEVDDVKALNANNELCAEGEAITSFLVIYNQPVRRAYNEETYQLESKEITLVGPKGDIKLTETGRWMWGEKCIEYAYIGENPEFYYDEEAYGDLPKRVTLTAAGTYTLDLSQILVDYGRDENWNYAAVYGSVADVYTFTIAEGATGIEGVEAKAENAEIYDLTGRRVEKITNVGIYIVNGHKVLVK